MPPPRRFLLCTAWTPWGPPRGFQHRLGLVAETLGALGTVDVCVVDRWRSPELELDWPDWVGDAEWCRVERLPEARPWSRRRASPVRDVVPNGARAAAVARFFSRSYDLTWCSEPRAFEPVADLIEGPVVLDLHNVISASVGYKARLVHRRPWLAAAWRDAIDDPAYVPGIERRWRSWEAAAVGRADRVVVCSDIDRDRVGGAATVVPNCYRRPARPAGRGARADAPLRIGFVGFLAYQPNFDAVHWFARSILPLVRREEPDAELVVIGDGAAPLVARRMPNVRFLGFVPDLQPELEQLSVIVSPIRFGGGTRFKIVEAFAHELPVVSTAIGAEGLGAVDGEHVLVREDPTSFAKAVVELHRDRARQAHLVANAARLYDDRYTWERGVAAVEQVVTDLCAPVGR